MDNLIYVVEWQRAGERNTDTFARLDHAMAFVREKITLAYQVRTYGLVFHS